MPELITRTGKIVEHRLKSGLCGDCGCTCPCDCSCAAKLDWSAFQWCYLKLLNWTNLIRSSLLISFLVAWEYLLPLFTETRFFIILRDFTLKNLRWCHHEVCLLSSRIWLVYGNSIRSSKKSRRYQGKKDLICPDIPMMEVLPFVSESRISNGLFCSLLFFSVFQFLVVF